jgi:outer membrane protein TolC
LVELRFESGRENKGSYLLSQANLEQAKYDYLRSVDQIPAAQALLRRGLDEPNKAVDAIGEIPVAPPPAPPTDFESLAATLPEARQAREASASARAGVEIARAAFLPAIKLDASLGRIGDDVFPKQERSRLLLEVTIPLFDGGRDLYGARGASALLSAAGAAQAGNLRQLAATLTQAYSAYVEAEAQLKVNGAYVRATETRSEIARRQYENGLLGFDQWDIIENDLIARQRALVASKRDRALAERAWLQATSQEEAP